MIVTQNDAKKIIRAYYGDMPFRLTTGCSIGVRPIYDTRISLAWRKLDKGKDSAVNIGQLLPGGTINWDWSI